MLFRAEVFPWLILPILLMLSTVTIGSSSSRLRGTVCFRRVSQTVSYLTPIRFTELVRTRKCKFLIFCETAYRTRISYRMEKRTKTTYKMKFECCEGYHEVGGICIADPTHNPHFVTTLRDSSSLSTSDILPSYELSTSTVQQRTIFEDQRTGGGSPTNAWVSRNTTEPILIDANKELQITDGNQTTLIIAFIACILSAFIIIVVIVIYRRRKKAAKYMGEIPFTPDVMPLPSKSKQDCSAQQEGLNYRNFPPTDENFYMSMDSACTLQVPSVKMMLATRGSGYRFSGLEEEPRRHADSLYVAPDSATYNNESRKVTVGIDCQDRKCANKTPADKGTSDIYINGRGVAAKLQDEDEENVYSEIKTKNYKRIDPVGDEHGYSFIRMDYVKESAPQDGEKCEIEMPLYTPLEEYSNGNSNNNGMKDELNLKQTDAKTTELDGKDSLIQTKLRTNPSRQNDTGETETRDDTCDSGIYTSINIDSDKDDETGSEVLYDKPKNKTGIDETRRNELQQTGTDFYENCRRNSDDSNYDIPRSQKKDEEDAIYSDIAPSSDATDTSIVARVS